MSLKDKIEQLPRRVEPISGQQFTYVKLDDVLALIDDDNQGPMRQKPMTDDWLFTDEFNQMWRLRRTGDEGMPLLIELIARPAVEPREEPR